MPPIDIDREAAREAAENELTKPIYPRGSLTDQFNQWIDELIFRIVAKGDLLPGGWFTLAVLAIIAVIAVIVAVRIARRTLHTRRGGDPSCSERSNSPRRSTGSWRSRVPPGETGRPPSGTACAPSPATSRKPGC